MEPKVCHGESDRSPKSCYNLNTIVILKPWSPGEFHLYFDYFDALGILSRMYSRHVTHTQTTNSLPLAMAGRGLRGMASRQVGAQRL